MSNAIFVPQGLPRDVLLVPDDGEPWWVHALCGSVDDPDLFFDPTRIKEAQAVCARCPVREPCSSANRSTESSTGRAHWHGVVAGETANARRTHARRSRARR